MLLGYKAWASRLLYEALDTLPAGIVEAKQKIVFGSILRTLHHTCVMDEVWRANLLGKPHGHQTRNPASCPPLGELVASQVALDEWFHRYGERLADRELSEPVEFTFIDGGPGWMTRFEILAHVVNHATYHRGHVAAMLYEAGFAPPTTDLPVYLRCIR